MCLTIIFFSNFILSIKTNVFQRDQTFFVRGGGGGLKFLLPISARPSVNTSQKNQHWLLQSQELYNDYYIDFPEKTLLNNKFM